MDSWNGLNILERRKMAYNWFLGISPNVLFMIVISLAMLFIGYWMFIRPTRMQSRVSVENPTARSKPWMIREDGQFYVVEERTPGVDGTFTIKFDDGSSVPYKSGDFMALNEGQVLVSNQPPHWAETKLINRLSTENSAKENQKLKDEIDKILRERDDIERKYEGEVKNRDDIVEKQVKSRLESQRATSMMNRPQQYPQR
jgi:hypothetical protein